MKPSPTKKHMLSRAPRENASRFAKLKVDSTSAYGRMTEPESEKIDVISEAQLYAIRKLREKPRDGSHDIGSARRAECVRASNHSLQAPYNPLFLAGTHTGFIC